MKITIISILFLAPILSTGCFAIINSTFESPRLLDKHSVSLQGSYSACYGSTLDEELENVNNNLGVAIGYGASDRFNLKFRYERLNVKVRTLEIFNE